MAQNTIDDDGSQTYDLVLPNQADENAAPPADPIELEIEDDTPEEDRGRTPLPKPLKEELEADELDDYDDKVKERLKQMRKVWHDERREKESMAREHAAAVEFARRTMAENQSLRNTLTTGGQEYAAILKLAAKHEVDAAARAYKEAYENGDSDKIVEAQNALQQANYRMMQAQNFRLPPLQPQQAGVQPQQAPAPRQEQHAPQQQQLDPKLVAWQERNSWYGSDDEMTAAALGLHQKLLQEGEVEIGSDEYYAVLDKTMRRRFPENFGAAPEARGNRQTIVAPATRSTAPRRVRLTKSEVALANRLGITPEQYAREKRKMES